MLCLSFGRKAQFIDWKSHDFSGRTEDTGRRFEPQLGPLQNIRIRVDGPKSKITLAILRPRPHVYGYFRIRNFFVADTATVHTYTANSTANP